MTERELPPLEPWADRARGIFWFAIGTISILRLLDYVGLLERIDRPWLWIHNACVPTWMVAGAVWAVGAWRRHHRRPRPDEDGTETPRT